MVLYGHQGRGPYARAERRKQISGTPSAGIILLWEATEMKKTKKLAALILALMMAFSLMAVTAAAYGADEHIHDGTCCEETIQPRKPGGWCPKCLGPASYYISPGKYGAPDTYVYDCPKCGVVRVTG